MECIVSWQKGQQLSQHLTLRETCDDCKRKSKAKEIWPVRLYVIKAPVKLNPLSNMMMEDWPTKCTSMDKPVRTTCTQSSKASGEGTGGQGSKLLLRSWSAPKKTPANWLKCVVGQYEILALPWTRKMVSTTILNTVSAIITEIDRFTKGRPWDDLKCDSARVDELGWQWPYLKARSAMSWNQMALTTLESRKNGRTQRVEKATDRTGWV